MQVHERYRNMTPLLPERSDRDGQTRDGGRVSPEETRGDEGAGEEDERSGRGRGETEEAVEEQRKRSHVRAGATVAPLVSPFGFLFFLSSSRMLVALLNTTHRLTARDFFFFFLNNTEKFSDFF